MQRIETEHADEIAKAKEKQKEIEEKGEKEKKKKNKKDEEGKDGKEDTKTEEKKETKSEEGKDVKKEENRGKKDVPAVLNDEPRIFSLNRNFFQMRIDRIRNAELAKRNIDRLQTPGAFPSVPNGTL